MENKQHENILSVENLKVIFPLERETVEAVRGISFTLKAGQTLGLVGETGAGKTTTALSLLKLVPSPGVVSCDAITVNGKNVPELKKKELETYRGKDIAMIFQDPMTSLNPVFPVGEQIADSILLHEKVSREEAEKKAEAMLELVGIPTARSLDYPHQFSGGMKQRVVIAIALACNPAVLIADEPTTALDVTIQAQVLNLMRKLRDEREMAMIMITHDLGIVAEICDTVAVMYAGEIVETGTLEEVFNHTRHPYTEGLFNSLPNIRSRQAKLKPIPGLIPDMAHLPEGCAFAPRCKYADENCLKSSPLRKRFSGTHFATCSAYAREGFAIERLEKE